MAAEAGHFFFFFELASLGSLVALLAFLVQTYSAFGSLLLSSIGGTDGGGSRWWAVYLLYCAVYLLCEAVYWPLLAQTYDRRFACFTSTNVRILTRIARAGSKLKLGEGVCAVYLLYWYKSTNTDTCGAVCTFVPASGGWARVHLLRRFFFFSSANALVFFFLLVPSKRKLGEGVPVVVVLVVGGLCLREAEVAIEPE